MLTTHTTTHCGCPKCNDRYSVIVNWIHSQMVLQRDTHLLNLFNNLFTLSAQASWNMFRISSAISTRVISILWTKDFSMAEWWQLPKIVQNIGPIGQPTSSLWDWTLTYRMQPTNIQSEPSCSHSYWNGDRFGQRGQPNKNPGIWQAPSLTCANVRRLC